jgi:hypothetical protein
MSNPSRTKWRDIALGTIVAILLLISRVLADVAVIQSHYGWFTKILLGITLSIFGAGILLIFFGPFEWHREPPPNSNLKLEIRTKGGSVLATGVDPTDVQEIAKVLREAKRASE